MTTYSTVFRNIVANTVTINTETIRTRNFLTGIGNRLSDITKRGGSASTEIGWTGNDQAALNNQVLIGVGRPDGVTFWTLYNIDYSVMPPRVPPLPLGQADKVPTLLSYPSSIPGQLQLLVTGTISTASTRMNANYTTINTHISTSQSLLSTTASVLATVLTTLNSIDTYIRTNAVPLKNTVDTTTITAGKQLVQLTAQEQYFTARKSLSTLQGTQTSLNNVLTVLNGTAYITTIMTNAATVATNTNTICNTLGDSAGCTNTTNSVNKLAADIGSQKTNASIAISGATVTVNETVNGVTNGVTRNLLVVYGIIVGLYTDISTVVNARLIGNTNYIQYGMAALAKPDSI
jgi:hypothetical protein